MRGLQIKGREQTGKEKKEEGNDGDERVEKRRRGKSSSERGRSLR